MLPSKGYFSSIDCPFYANKLCHRYYCQFRHTKSNSSFSPTRDIIDNLCEDESISEDILKDIVIETRMTSSSNISQNAGYQYSDEKKKSDVKNEKESLKHKSYMLPIDIPLYKPTPISKLKTRQNELKDSDVQPVKSHTTKPNIKNNSLVNNSFHYFGDINKKSHDRACEKVSYSDSKETVNLLDSLTTSCSESKFGQFIGSDNSKNNSIDHSSIDLLVKENQKLKEMVLQLKSKSDNELRDNNVVMNEQLLMDLIGINEPVKSRGDDTLKDQSVVKKDQKPTSSKHKTNKDDYSKHKSVGKHSSSTSKSRGSKRSYEQKRHKEVKHKEKHKQSKKSDRYSKSTKSVTNTDSFSNNSSPEVIVISDSEELDITEHLDDSDDNDDYEDDLQSTIDSFPQPKKKQRVSHVKESSGTTTYKRTASKDCFTVHNITKKEENKDNYPQTKQKSRVAHTIKYQSLAFQSVGEHVTHWQQVRDRIKKKCVNPSGEEGYQNWSKIKISPVSNVSSIINSKKSIFSKIKQWKTK